MHISFNKNIGDLFLSTFFKFSYNSLWTK